MSYGFDMRFSAAETLGESMVLANSFVEKLANKETVKVMLEDQKYYIPSLQYGGEPTRELWASRMAEDEAWLHGLLKANFVYWPKQKLLGLAGDAWPNAKEFFPEAVYFQNSCDQDNKLNSWPKLPFFEEIVEIHRHMNGDDLLHNGRWNDYTSEEINENLNYNIRTDAYAQIFSELNLEEWLWGNENKAFVRFSLSAIRSSEERYAFLELLRKLSKENNPELWNPIKSRDGWIPCEKLMPENSSEVKFFDGYPHFATVLATYRYANSSNIGSGPSNYTLLEDGTYEWSVVHIGMAEEVIAWMPMPKPFKV